MQCIRPGVLLEAASLPCLSITDRHGQAAHLNNYIVDWWSHGSIKLLETANGLQEGKSAAALLHCILCLECGVTADSPFRVLHQTQNFLGSSAVLLLVDRCPSPVSKDRIAWIQSTANLHCPLQCQAL